MIHLNTIKFYDIEPPPLSELCSCYTSSSRSFKNQVHDVSPREPFISLSLSLTVCDLLLKIYARLTMDNIPTPLKWFLRFLHSLNNTEMIYVNDMFNLFNTKINFRIEVTVFCETPHTMLLVWRAGLVTCSPCEDQHPTDRCEPSATTGGTNITLATLTAQHAEIMLNTTIIEIKQHSSMSHMYIFCTNNPQGMFG